ncbi:AraC family transcriptional regulator ligand-binding domain-containing protein [Methylobacterium oryzisoli]|uniref:AraC family transcriptional regulator ligand-binding domain-containing protein n=1 Tax=Methylobacterium oryzisoli TaxID=3385502 RepID=UPI0038912B2D
MGAPVLPASPSTIGVVTRLAVAHATNAGLDAGSFLERVGLTTRQIEDPRARIGVANQVALLDRLAAALDDDLLGLHLAQGFEPGMAGLVYYVMASAPTLRDVLDRAERFGAVGNEGISLTCSRSEEGVHLRFTTIGFRRAQARHQMEFWTAGMIRILQHLTATRLQPIEVSFIHARNAGSGRLEELFGCPVRFCATQDGLTLTHQADRSTVLGADPYLHDLLLAYCEEALAHRQRPQESLRTRIENAIAPLLPHGRPVATEIARMLGMSQRTLSRRLADEGLTFGAVLEEMRRDLALRYLQDATLPISRIGWLLGFQETGAFTHAFRRWTGRTPTEVRAGGAPLDQLGYGKSLRQTHPISSRAEA